MKTIKKMLVLVTMMAIATGYANESCINTLTTTTTLKFFEVKIGHQYSIKDHQGSVIYSETIKRNGSFLKEFDFTNLDDGLYTFEISKDFEILIQPFKIESQIALFSEKSMTKEFKPVVRVDNDILMVSQLTLDAKPLRLKLVYNGELIFSDELKGAQVLERKYKLSNEEKGTYHISFTSGNRYFSEWFTL